MEKIRSDIQISLNGIALRTLSELPLTLLDGTRAFRREGGKPDVLIRVRVMEQLPVFSAEPLGTDLLLNYYRDGERFYAAARPGKSGPVTVTEYTPDFSDVTVYVNEKELPGVIRTMDKLLQLFPIRQLLAQYQAMILHASQIRVKDRGILFTAPSGTGKSTQARLWEQYAQAKCLCNDRTLLRRHGERYLTCGYPVDGSDPVYSSLQVELGAAVVLRQGAENRVERLPASKALKYLMEQTVADAWNMEEQWVIQNLWLDLLERCPVYMLVCRPDRGAVECLKERLERDGVV